MKNDPVTEFVEKINRRMAEREPLDLNEVYDRLKDIYPLCLTNTLSLPDGAEDYGEDFLILCGEARTGSFRLYDNGLDIVFDAEKTDGTSVHWHPVNIEEAISDVIMFMQGNSRF